MTQITDFKAIKAVNWVLANSLLFMALKAPRQPCCHTHALGLRTNMVNMSPVDTVVPPGFCGWRSFYIHIHTNIVRRTNIHKNILPHTPNQRQRKERVREKNKICVIVCITFSGWPGSWPTVSSSAQCSFLHSSCQEY